jgi:ribonuclease HI
VSDDYWKLHFDGGSRGNPGPAAYGWVLHRPDGSEAARGCESLGVATNNVAEYTGLVRGLEHAAEAGVSGLRVFGDSELIIKQLKGEYRVKNAALKPLYERATQLLSRVAPTTVAHVYRDQNAVADSLVNEALDALL